jgi:hypothetical protein
MVSASPKLMLPFDLPLWWYQEWSPMKWFDHEEGWMSFSQDWINYIRASCYKARPPLMLCLFHVCSLAFLASIILWSGTKFSSDGTTIIGLPGFLNHEPKYTSLLYKLSSLKYSVRTTENDLRHVTMRKKGMILYRQKLLNTNYCIWYFMCIASFDITAPLQGRWCRYYCKAAHTGQGFPRMQL